MSAYFQKLGSYLLQNIFCELQTDCKINESRDGNKLQKKKNQFTTSYAVLYTVGIKNSRIKRSFHWR